MPKPEFVHLHLHSEFSLLDGACRCAPLIKRLKELNMSTVALTDHGNMFGAIGFYQACRDAGIKPIIGCEVYVAPRGRHERGESGERRSANHLLLLAKDYDGYRNLAKLSSIGYLEGYYYKPRVDHEVLAQHAQGLIATSSCLKGEIPEAIVEGRTEDARRLTDAYIQIFGRENYYFEIQDHQIPEQRLVIETITGFAKHYGAPLLATNDCHYVNREDAGFHDILLCIQTGKTLQDEKRFRFYNEEFYVKSAEEMYALFPEFPEACRETVAAAEKCNLEIPFGKRYLPKFETPNGETEAEYLRAITLEGLARRYDRPDPAHTERLDYELGVITQMGFAAYFLIVWDFIRYAKTNGIPVGPGRGSAAGSLVAYCLEITDIDPIEHGLIFERFLNPERISMPDIDIDFCFERRGQVIDYVKKKYGADHVAQIITFGTLQPKNAVRDIGRAMNVPLGDVDKIARQIPAMIKGDKKETGIDKALKEAPELKELYDKDAAAHAILDHARKIEGIARHASTHPAGIVIADRPIMELVPVYRPPNTQDMATQYTMTNIEELGLLKMDFLGLKNLTVIENTVNSVRRNYGEEVGWHQIPLDDPDTYRILRAGRTFGVFQLESSGMTNLVVALGPTNFEDLTALLALYRPGPLGSGMHQDYVERKHGRKKVEYDHPMLEPILRETYGIILYQEQVMMIPQTLAGFTLGEADLMRRAMGKKKPEEMAKQRDAFVRGCAVNGISGQLANQIFDKIDYFSGYGFNKSHSAAYALISFRTAYLKAHYPVDYLAALMTNAIGGKVENMIDYFTEAREAGIPVLPPDVNESQKHFAVVGSSVRFGLAAVKNVGEGAVDCVIAAREEGGPFTGLEDFCRRVDLTSVNAKTVESLVRVGAFDFSGVRRSQLLDGFKGVMETEQAQARERESGQSNLFDSFDEAVAGDPSGIDGRAAGGGLRYAFRDIPEVPEREKLQWEKELIGYFVSGHPLDQYVPDMAAFATAPLAKVLQAKDGEVVKVVGLITGLVTRTDRRGGAFGYVKLEDLSGELEILFFSDAFQKCRPMLVPDQVVCIKARINERNGQKGLIANDARPVDVLREKDVAAVEVRADLQAVAANGRLEKLAEIVARHPGRKPVQVVVTGGPEGELRVELGKKGRIKVASESLRELTRCFGPQNVKFVRNTG